MARPRRREPRARDRRQYDGFRILARRDGSTVRLLTRNGNDFACRFPSVAAAVHSLPSRSWVIDGEAIVRNEKRLAVFDLIRGHCTLESAVCERLTCWNWTETI